MDWLVIALHMMDDLPLFLCTWSLVAFTTMSIVERSFEPAPFGSLSDLGLQEENGRLKPCCTSHQGVVEATVSMPLSRDVFDNMIELICCIGNNNNWCRQYHDDG